MNDSQLIFVGGTSHAGKTTFARQVAAKRKARLVPTDSLGRHPGRPWGPVAEKPDVVSYYLDLTPEEQLADVLRHYRETIWPFVEEEIGKASGPVVIEGSAVLPEFLAGRDGARTCCWLASSPDEIRERIWRESDRVNRDAKGQRLVDAFVTRSLLFQDWLLESLAASGLAAGIPDSLRDF